MKLDASLAEPAAPLGRERRRFGNALKSEESSVEALSISLASRRHGQLNVVQRDDFEVQGDSASTSGDAV
jgi:hypothetical protein